MLLNLEKVRLLNLPINLRIDSSLLRQRLYIYTLKIDLLFFYRKCVKPEVHKSNQDIYVNTSNVLHKTCMNLNNFDHQFLQKNYQKLIIPGTKCVNFKKTFSIHVSPVKRHSQFESTFSHDMKFSSIKCEYFSLMYSKFRVFYDMLMNSQ